VKQTDRGWPGFCDLEEGGKAYRNLVSAGAGGKVKSPKVQKRKGGGGESQLARDKKKSGEGAPEKIKMGRTRTFISERGGPARRNCISDDYLKTEARRVPRGVPPTRVAGRKRRHRLGLQETEGEGKPEMKKASNFKSRRGPFQKNVQQKKQIGIWMESAAEAEKDPREITKTKGADVPKLSRKGISWATAGREKR